MIKNITAGPGLTITGAGLSNYVSKSYNSNAQHMVGSMMYDLDMQCLKVYDGSAWQMLHMQTAAIDLDNDTKALLEWARKKRNEEMERDLLAQTSPTIKDLIKQIEEKEEQILVVQNLLREESKIGTS